MLTIAPLLTGGWPMLRLGLAVIRSTPSHIVPKHRGDAMEQLLRYPSDIEADIIVAGAYGHTRMREWIFGGVTRDLITKSDRCSVLSH